MHPRVLFSFLVLLSLKAFSKVFFRSHCRWVGEYQDWDRVRVVAILNHTSLFEWLFVAAAPNRFLYRIARYAAIPVADKTTGRVLTGVFFKLLSANVIPVTREADDTWQQVVDHMGPENFVVLLPEGRMKRANGLDSNGQPMTVRGGIADLIEVAGEGRLLLAYSAGLHHVQVPGEGLPHLFRDLHLQLESLDLAAYRELCREQAKALVADRSPSQAFKIAVIQDLTARRDRYCQPFD